MPFETSSTLDCSVDAFLRTPKSLSAPWLLSTCRDLDCRYDLAIKKEEGDSVRLVGVRFGFFAFGNSEMFWCCIKWSFKSY